MKYLSPGIYKHYKGPNYYVLGVTKSSTDDESWYVVYWGTKLSDGSAGPSLHVREYDDFTSWVDRQTGKTVPEPTYEDSLTTAIPRFEYIPHLV